MLRLCLLIAMAGITACGSPSGQTPRPVPSTPIADTCGAAPYARLVGQDATVLERELILRQVRVTRPGDLVTQDFVPERLNFEIGPAGRITRVSCG